MSNADVLAHTEDARAAIGWAAVPVAAATWHPQRSPTVELAGHARLADATCPVDPRPARSSAVLLRAGGARWRETLARATWPLSPISLSIPVHTDHEACSARARSTTLRCKTPGRGPPAQNSLDGRLWFDRRSQQAHVCVLSLCRGQASPFGPCTHVTPDGEVRSSRTPL